MSLYEYGEISIETRKRMARCSICHSMWAHSKETVRHFKGCDVAALEAENARLRNGLERVIARHIESVGQGCESASRLCDCVQCLARTALSPPTATPKGSDGK